MVEPSSSMDTGIELIRSRSLDTDDVGDYAVTSTSMNVHASAAGHRRHSTRDGSVFGRSSTAHFMKEKLQAMKRESLGDSTRFGINSTFRQVWSVAHVVFVLYYVLVTSVRFGFSDSFDAWLILDYMVDVFFLVDFVLHAWYYAVIAYDHTHTHLVYLTESRQIFRHFMKKPAFYWSLFASVPWDWFVLPAGWKVVFAVRMVKLAHLESLYHTMAFLRQHFTALDSNPVIRRLVTLFCQILLAAHVCGPALYYLGDWEESRGDGKSWLQGARGGAEGIQSGTDPTWEKYLKSVYFAVTTMTSVGYGDFYPITTTERVAVMALQLFGWVTFGRLVGNLAPVLESRSAQKTDFLLKLSQAQAYMETEQTADQTVNKVVAVFQLQWDRFRGVDENDIFSQFLPPGLRREVGLFLLEGGAVLRDAVPYLHDCPTAMLRELVNGASFEAYLPGDVIVQKGAMDDRLIVLLGGTTKDGGAAHSVYGALDFFDDSALTKETVVADTHVDAMIFTKALFMDILEALKDQAPVYGRMYARLHDKDYLTTERDREVSLHESALQRRKRRDGKPKRSRSSTMSLLLEQVPVILPGSSFRVAWDTLSLVFVVYYAIIVPFRLAFWLQSWDEFTSWDWAYFSLDWAIDLFFVVDIVLRLGWFALENPTNAQRPIVSRDIILTNYLKGGFLLDLIAALPLDVIELLTRDRLKWLLVLRVNKLLRVRYAATLFQAFNRWAEKKTTERGGSVLKGTSFLSISTDVAFALLLFHWIGCLWFFLSELQAESDPVVNPWVIVDGLFAEKVPGVPLTPLTNRVRQYIRSFHWAFVTGSMVGYGGIFPYTNSEIAFAVVVMLTATLTYFYILAKLTTFAEDLNRPSHEFDKKQAVVFRFMERGRLDQFQKRIHGHRNFLWSLQRGYGFRNTNILREFPPHIRSLLTIEMAEPVLKSSFPMLANYAGFISTLLGRLEPAIYAPGDEICRRGVVATTVFFRTTGKVRRLTGGNASTQRSHKSSSADELDRHRLELELQDDNDRTLYDTNELLRLAEEEGDEERLIGEEAIVVAGSDITYRWTYMALTACGMLLLKADEFRAILSRYSMAKLNFERSMLDGPMLLDSDNDGVDGKKQDEDEVQRAALREIGQVQSEGHWTIHPHSREANTMDMLRVMIILYQVLVIPLRIAFDRSPWDDDKIVFTHLTLAVDAVVDIYHLWEMFYFFRFNLLGFGDSGEVVAPSVAYEKYKRKHLWKDLAATCVLDNFVLLWPDTGMRLLFWLRLTRLIRIRLFTHFLEVLEKRLTQNKMRNWMGVLMRPSVFRIAKQLVYLFGFTHFFACAWYYVGDQERVTNPEEGRLGWLNQVNQVTNPIPGPVSDRTLAQRYLYAFYFTLVSISSVGYGDIKPQTTAETIMGFFLLGVGLILYATVTANIASVAANVDSARIAFEAKVNSVGQFMRRGAIKGSLYRTIMDHYYQLWDSYKGVAVHETLESFPVGLRSDITWHLYGEVLSRVAIFRDMRGRALGQFIKRLSSLVVHEWVEEGRDIIVKGRVSDSMFILTHGQVLRHESGKRHVGVHTTDVKKYDWFGEQNVLAALPPVQTETYTAETPCDVLKLRHADLVTALDEFPHLKASFVESTFYAACERDEKQLEAVKEEEEKKKADEEAEDNEEYEEDEDDVMTHDELIATLRANKHSTLSHQQSVLTVDEKVHHPACVPLVRHDTQFRQWWDMVVFLALVYHLITIPALSIFRGAENKAKYWGLIGVSWFVDIFFMLDLFMRSRRFVPQTMQRRNEPWTASAVWNYYWHRDGSVSRFSVVLDVIAVFPLDWVVLIVNNGTDRNENEIGFWRANHLVFAYRFLGLFDKVRAYAEQNDAWIFKFTAKRYGRMAFVCILTLHLLACGIFLIGKDSDGETWYTKQRLDEESSPFTRYLVSLYWTCTTITTTGYGDITPVNSQEVIFCLIMFLVGDVIYADIVGSISVQQGRAQEALNRHLHKVKSLRLYMRYRRLPVNFRNAILAYQDYHFTLSRGVDDDALYSLPHAFVSRVAYRLYHGLIDSVGVFNDIGDHDFLKLLATFVQRRVILKGDGVYFRGDLAKEIFLIESGAVQVFRGGRTTYEPDSTVVEDEKSKSEDDNDDKDEEEEESEVGDDGKGKLEEDDYYVEGHYERFSKEDWRLITAEKDNAIVLREGDVFGEMSFFMSKFRQSTVVCMERGEFLYLSSTDLWRVLQVYRHYVPVMAAAVAKRAVAKGRVEPKDEAVVRQKVVENWTRTAPAVDRDAVSERARQSEFGEWFIGLVEGCKRDLSSSSEN